MKVHTIVIALAAAAAALADPRELGAQAQIPPEIQTEYDKRVAQLNDELVQSRATLAQDLRAKKLYVWAHKEYDKILAVRADHEGARKALGYVRDGSAWAAGGKAIPTVNRETTEKELVAEAARYHERLDRLGAAAAERHLAIASWCEKNGLAEWGKHHRVEAHAFDPASENVKTALAFETSEIMPVASHPETVKLFDELRTGDKDVPLGEIQGDDATWGPDDLKGRMVVVHGKYVGFESTWIGKESNAGTKGWLEQLARRGDHAYVMAHKHLREKMPENEPRYQFAYLDDYSYKHMTKWAHLNDSETSYAHLLLPDCRSWRTDRVGRRVSRREEKENPLEDPSHLVPQFVLTRRLWADKEPDNRDALIEGFGVLAEFIGNQSNTVWCSGGPSTTTGGARQDYRQFSAVQAKTLDDYPVSALFKAGFNSLAREGNGAAKAASILEWRFAVDPEGAVSFIRAMADPKVDPESVIRKETGWSVEQFEEHWRRWSIAIAEADFSAALAAGKTEFRCPNCTHLMTHYDYRAAMIAGVLRSCPSCRKPLPKELQRKPKNLPKDDGW